MIVADSSVWIGHFRGAESEACRKLYSIGLEEGLLVGDIILLEILRGARDARHARRMEDDLRRWDIVPMLGVALAIRAAENYRALRSLGITVRKAADLIIATYCLAHGHALLHNDRDFEPMCAHLGLRVV